MIAQLSELVEVNIKQVSLEDELRLALTIKVTMRFTDSMHL